MRDVDVDGQRIAVEERGSGSPVLMLHSSGMASRQWRRLMTMLAPNHRVLGPDLVGYGRSAPWNGPGRFRFSVDEHVAEIIAAEADAPVHLVGHSYGAFLALLVAASGRVPVASVSVYDPVAFGVLYAEKDQIGIEALERVDHDARMFAPELQGTAEWCERFVNFWNGPGYWRQLPEVMQEAFLTAARKTFDEVESLVLDRTGTDAYSRIRAPTLLLTGSATPLAEHRVMDVLARVIPRARLERIDGAGHMGPLTHGAVVDPLILSHIEGNDVAAS